MAALTRSLACVRSSHLVPTGAMERLASLNVEDYVYPTPTPQQVHMLQQQAALLSAPQLPLQQRGPASMPAAPIAASASVPFCQLPLSASVLPVASLAAVKVGGAQAACVDLLDSMLPLDLDDDCLRLMFGEEAAEGGQGAGDGESSKSGGSAVSALQGSEQRLTRSAAAAKGVEAEQSSADDEDDAVDLLFQDLSSLGHVASYGDLDLDVLQALQQDFDAEGADSAKRARREPNLMLSMNYASAAQTINSIMSTGAGGRKAVAGFGLGGSVAVPGSPDSLASADTLELERSNSTGKRKRAM